MTPTRRPVAAALALALVLAGTLGACSSSPKPDSYAGSTVKEANARAGQEQQAATVACQADHDALAQAIATYELTEQAEPTKMADVVPSYLHDAPPEWSIEPGADGKPKIVLSAAGRKAGCTEAVG